MKSVEFWLCLARVWLVSLDWGGFLTFYGGLGGESGRREKVHELK
jgi:hypothetical protein